MLLVQRHSASGWTKAAGAELGNQGVDNCSGNQATELHSCCGPGHHRQDLGTLWAFQKEMGPDLSLLMVSTSRDQKPNLLPLTQDWMLQGKHSSDSGFVDLENEGCAV